MSKDTPEWKAYYEEVAKHKAYMETKKPKPDFENPDYPILLDKWQMEYAMTMPNPPGYYRANND